jgi:hypothetical protein
MTLIDLRKETKMPSKTETTKMPSDYKINRLAKKLLMRVPTHAALYELDEVQKDMEIIISDFLRRNYG